MKIFCFILKIFTFRTVGQNKQRLHASFFTYFWHFTDWSSNPSFGKKDLIKMNRWWKSLIQPRMRQCFCDGRHFNTLSHLKRHKQHFHQDFLFSRDRLCYQNKNIYLNMMEHLVQIFSFLLLFFQLVVILIIIMFWWKDLPVCANSPLDLNQKKRKTFTVTWRGSRRDAELQTSQNNLKLKFPWESNDECVCVCVDSFHPSRWTVCVCVCCCLVTLCLLV